MSVNSIEDYKYVISFEVDADKLNSSLNNALKKGLNLVKDFETNVFKTFRNIAKYQGEQARKNFETQRKFNTKILQSSKDIEKRVLKSREDNYRKFYQNIGEMAKTHNDKIPKTQYAPKENSYYNNKYSTVDRIITGGLYSIGNRIAYSISNAFSETVDKDLLIRQILTKVESPNYKPKYDEIKEIINHLGNTTRFTNNEIAKSMELGATLGLKEELAEITKLATDFAQASNKDLPNSLEKITMMFNSFGIKEKKDREDFVNELYYISKSSALDLERAFEGLKQFAPIAKQTGIKQQEIFALLGTLNNMGITGSQAGTTLQAMVNNATNSKKRQKLETILGRTIADSKGNLDVRNLMQGLTEKLSTISSVDKLAIMQDLFNIRGAKAMNTLTFDNAIKEFDKLLNGVNNEAKNTVSRAVGEQNSGIGGKFYLMISKMNTTFQELINSATPILVPLMDTLGILAKSLTVLLSKAPQLVEYGIKFASILLAPRVWQIAILSLGRMTQSLKTMISLSSIFKASFILVMFGIISSIIELINKSPKLRDEFSKTLSIIFDLGIEILNVFLGIFNALFDFNFELLNSNKGAEQLSKAFVFIRLVLEKVVGYIKKFNEFIKAHSYLFKILSIIIVISKSITFILTLIKTINIVFSTITTILTTIGSVLSFPISAIILGIVVLLGIIIHKWSYVKSLLKNIASILYSFGSTLINVGSWIVNFIVSPFKTAYDWVMKIITPIKNLMTSGAKIKVDTSTVNSAYNSAMIGVKTNNTTTTKNSMLGSGMISRNAVGTDNFKGGLTTIDEIGDEAIWLPNGSMIAHNTTTRDMLLQLKSINKNQRNFSFLRNSNKGIHIDNITVNIKSDNGKDVANELLQELTNLSYN